MKRSFALFGLVPALLVAVAKLLAQEPARTELDPYSANNVARDLAAAPVPAIYTSAHLPPTLTLEQLALKTSVSQYGITWTFAQPARVGQFINGDWYVVGPAVVEAIDPRPLY